MTWLNWSLKLHIRLRTISILVPTHITHVYAQWMSYSFVWLYLFKYVAHTQFLLIKYKKIFECFIEKYFVFAKISKISKTMLPCFGDLVAGHSNLIPPIASLHRRFSRLTSGLMSQSRKRLRKFSKILGFHSSRDSIWRLVHEWKLQSQGYLEIFVWLPWNFQWQKTLGQIFQNFCHRVFGDLSWLLVHDLVQSRKMRVFRFKDIF